MIKFEHGNLLETDVEALVNTVNCVGVMGKGVALQFRQAYPSNYRAYAAACRSGLLKPGDVLAHDLGPLLRPRLILNVATKGHWRTPSRIEYIERGMSKLVDRLQEYGIRSVALPPLGCGNGGLDWAQVRPVIERELLRVPDVEAIVFAPGPPPAAEGMPVGTTMPAMTPGRAVLLQLMAAYAVPGYRLTKIELQKLAYFLQCAGEPLRLDFVGHKFGPYAAALDHVLQRLEGHFIRGYGDRTGSTGGIALLPGAAERSAQFLVSQTAAARRLDRVAELIAGFENPFGLELLATVHWVAKANADIATRPDLLAERVAKWSGRKKRLFAPDYVRRAWDRLGAQGWLDA